MRSKDKLWFLVKFLGAAALLFSLWLRGGADVYGQAALLPAALLSPMITGYRVEFGGDTGYFVDGTTRVRVPLNLRESLAGIVPFLALVIASGNLPWRRRLWAGLVGLVILYSVAASIVIISPLMVTPQPDWVMRILDVVSVFAFLGGFVALPFALWFVMLGWGAAASPRARMPEKPRSRSR
jgi:hypothetical protein